MTLTNDEDVVIKPPAAIKASITDTVFNKAAFIDEDTDDNAPETNNASETNGTPATTTNEPLIRKLKITQSPNAIPQTIDIVQAVPPESYSMKCISSGS